MIAGMHQTHYLPWIRYFEKIYRSDIFVLLDDIQYNKNGWQNRQKIKHANGWMYLTVPVYESFRQKINEVKIKNEVNWRKKHLKSIEFNYAKSPYFKEYIPFFREVYNKKWEYLRDLNCYMLKFFLEVLDIKTKLIISSELDDVEGEATERLISICKLIGADEYYTGAYAVKVYLEKEKFDEAGIKLSYQSWNCKEYSQLFKKAGFIPDLSVIDLLFNLGPEESLKLIIESGNN